MEFFVTELLLVLDVTNNLMWDGILMGRVGHLIHIYQELDTFLVSFDEIYHLIKINSYMLFRERD